MACRSHGDTLLSARSDFRRVTDLLGESLMACLEGWAGWFLLKALLQKTRAGALEEIS